MLGIKVVSNKAMAYTHLSTFGFSEAKTNTVKPKKLKFRLAHNKNRINMKTIKYIILILIIITQLTSKAQYNWEEVITPDTVELYRFTFDTTGNLYIGTNKGVYFSENDNQWQYLGPNDFASYIYINDNNTIYAGMNELYRSYDNGTTWDSIFYYIILKEESQVFILSEIL